MSGKGSRPRPLSVDRDTFDSNWDLVFKSKSNTVQSEIDALQRMRDDRSEGDRQAAAWLRDEHYDQVVGWVCDLCGRNRAKESCGLGHDPARMLRECPMQGIAYETK